MFLEWPSIAEEIKPKISLVCSASKKAASDKKKTAKKHRKN